MADAEHVGPVFGDLGDQPRARLQALGEHEYLGPPGSSRLVFVDRHRGVGMSGPCQQVIVGQAAVLGHRDERNVLDLEDALGSLAPRSGYADRQSQAQAT